MELRSVDCDGLGYKKKVIRSMTASWGKQLQYGSDKLAETN